MRFATGQDACAARPARARTQGTTVETNLFSVLRDETVRVEGADVKAWHVGERVHATGELKATWWLTNASPYTVLAEIPLANGQTSASRASRSTDKPVRRAAGTGRAASHQELFSNCSLKQKRTFVF
jgi:hypothetical protein